jgi:predicted short-subunit dehydrogenase-like oxidoreductase (DUF2520 family)
VPGFEAVMPGPGVAIVGSGRMGQGLGLALHHAGWQVRMLARSRHPVVPPLVVHGGPRNEATLASEVVLLAVPDDAIPELAAELASEGAAGPGQVILHLSGLLDRRALGALQASGAGLGSFHPLQTIADPAAAPRRLAGAYAGIEGDARALEQGGRLAQAMGMHPIRLSPEGKAAYHAGAVMAANYTIALAGVAERLARAAGVAPETAGRLYLPLIRGAADNLELGPAAALTGPVRRGDVRTVEAHLAALGPEDRELYRLLGLAALRLAREAGLAPAAAERLREALDRPG